MKKASTWYWIRALNFVSNRHVKEWSDVFTFSNQHRKPRGSFEYFSTNLKSILKIFLSFICYPCSQWYPVLHKHDKSGDKPPANSMIILIKNIWKHKHHFWRNRKHLRLISGRIYWGHGPLKTAKGKLDFYGYRSLLVTMWITMTVNIYAHVRKALCEMTSERLTDIITKLTRFCTSMTGGSDSVTNVDDWKSFSWTWLSEPWGVSWPTFPTAVI